MNMIGRILVSGDEEIFPPLFGFAFLSLSLSIFCLLMMMMPPWAALTALALSILASV